MTTTTEFQVTGMTCGHCELSVREEVQEIAGVETVEVSAKTGKLVVGGDSPVDEAAVIAAVEEAGYQAVKQATAADSEHSVHPVQGVTAEQGGYILQEVSAPATTGDQGQLSFTITAPDGRPVTEFETSHEKELHLIVVRSDGTHFRHVHPAIDGNGRWSLQWQWEAAGTYRVYADIVPAATGESLTLTRTVHVAGSFEPAEAKTGSTRDEVDGYDVVLEGNLTAGGASALSIHVLRDGQPVTDLEPYLGAYGHLVALRAGDLAYLHVHPEGDNPVEGQTSGPTVEFSVAAPSPGRYYLYFDFQIDAQVNTAAFVINTGASSGTAADGHSGH
ncbi:Copper chaperone CopZ [Arthrobacter crystallopoietes]|jgi:copper chaperone CopZ|nr:heavy metal-associated domain-containing protein [Paenarthrobacter aurescens]ABM10420.1 heavy metal-associated domain protein [Paenarthrobacter aurescens TC1]SDQ03452.1 Copper chaperone CopZ [Arthrobacter crystallopoietes]